MSTMVSQIGRLFRREIQHLLSGSVNVHEIDKKITTALSVPSFTATLNEHYSDVIMSAMASQITSLTIVYPTVYSGADQRKHQSSASLAFVRGIHCYPVNSPHKGPVMRKMFPFDDVIMNMHGLHFVLVWCTSLLWSVLVWRTLLLWSVLVWCISLLWSVLVWCTSALWSVLIWCISLLWSMLV